MSSTKRRTYERFHDDVFGLTNFVRDCLHEGDVAEAERALNGPISDTTLRNHGCTRINMDHGEGCHISTPSAQMGTSRRCPAF